MVHQVVGGGSMEDIRRVVKAAYANLTDEERIGMESEFKSMDKDEDGKISFSEFTSHSDQYTASFFSLLDQNGDGYLQLEEFSTLSYIIKSGRPFCAYCEEFIPGLFFTCRQCRLSPKTPLVTYDLCVDCYHEGKFDHRHADFDDNYKLLLRLQHMLLAAQQPRPSPSAQSSPRRPPQTDQPSDQSRRSCGARLKARISKSSWIVKEIVAGIVVSSIAAIIEGVGGGCCGGGDDQDDGDGQDDRNGDNDDPAADDPRRS